MYISSQCGSSNFLKPTIVSSVRKCIQLQHCVTSQAFKETRLDEANIMLPEMAFASSVTLLRGKEGGFLDTSARGQHWVSWQAAAIAADVPR